MAQDSPIKSNIAVHTPPGFTWFLRRAAIGVTVLFVFVVSIAWLTHTSLQADTEANAGFSDDVPETSPADVGVIRAVAPVVTERRQIRAE